MVNIISQKGQAVKQISKFTGMLVLSTGTGSPKKRAFSWNVQTFFTPIRL
jgi:hypothetical protein